MYKIRPTKDTYWFVEVNGKVISGVTEVGLETVAPVPIVSGTEKEIVIALEPYKKLLKNTGSRQFVVKDDRIMFQKTDEFKVDPEPFDFKVDPAPIDFKVAR